MTASDEAGQAPAPDETPENTPPARDTKPPDPTKVEDLPEWAQKEIKKAREEAAKYRTQARDAGEASKEAKTLADRLAALEESHEKALADQAEAHLSKLRYQAAVSAGVPTDNVEDIAGRLKGSTEEELKADAKKLAALLAPVARKPDRSQGRGDDSSTREVEPGRSRIRAAYASSNK